MDEQRISIQDVALKTYRKRWTIEKGDGRGSERSVLGARHDDIITVCVCVCVYIYIYIFPFVCTVHVLLNLGLNLSPLFEVAYTKIIQNYSQK